MAKRRAEDTLLHDPPSKRCHRSLCAVDLQLGGVAATAGGLSPPSLLALLGSRCRKRPYYFEDPEENREDGALHRKATHHHRDTRKPAAATVSAVNAPGSFQERRGCGGAPASSKKRAREDSTCPEAAAPTANDEANEDAEDATYNSFQYWRAPLPELDLSLLEDGDSQTKDKSKVKGSPSDAMET